MAGEAVYGRGFLALSPKLDSGFGRQLQSEVSSPGITRRLGGAAAKTGKVIGLALAGAAATAFAGAATVGFLAVKGGLTRALNIEDAQAKLAGLGHDVEAIETIMVSALDSVKGTAFGLDDAATAAASAVAAGVQPGEDLTRVLGLTGDAATIMGREFGDSGSIINKVLASNRVSMREINQLHDAGLPILQMLADQYGVNAEEMREMISEGVVGSEEFLDALENNIAGAALKSGETTRGAFANMGAAMSRFGEVVVKPFLPLIRNVIGGVTEVWDRLSDSMKPVMEQFQESDTFKRLEENSKRIPEIFGNMADKAKDLWFRARPLIDGVKDLAGRFKDWFTNSGGISGLLDSLKGSTGGLQSGLMLMAGPLALIARELFPLIKPLLMAIVPPLAEMANKLAPALGEVLQWLAAEILPGFIKIVEKVIGWVTENKGLVVAFGLAVVAFKILTAVMAINPFVLLAAAVIGIASLIVTNWDSIQRFLKRVWDWIKTTAASVGRWFKDKFAEAVEFVKNLFLNFTGPGLLIKHWDAIKEGITNVVGFFREKWDAVVDFFKGLPARISSAVSGMWDGIKNAFKGVINWVIDAWNRLRFTIPSIDTPFGKVGGGVIGVPTIPRLHDGGMVPGRPGQEMLAILEAGERVLSRAEVTAGAGRGDVTVYAQSNANPWQIGSAVSWAMKTSGV